MVPKSKIVILAYGTRGDVQPAIALGKALQKNGHRVTIVASANFQAWIEQHGLEAAPSRIDIQQIMSSEGGLAWAENGNSAWQELRAMQRLLNQYGFEMAVDSWQACQAADLVISSFTSYTYTLSITQQLGIPHASMWMQPPMVATRSGMTTMKSPLPRRKTILNYWFGKFMIEPGLWYMSERVVNRFRKEVLGLPSQSRQQNLAARPAVLLLAAYSPTVVPHPIDWPANIKTTGYWFLDEGKDWQPPDSLARFLEAGDPPVYIGFGSMTGRNPAQLTQQIVDAAQQNGCRVVLAAGWAGIGGSALPATIYPLQSAPHEWLMPRMVAAGHHGGAGTTAASLRAGLPTVIVPHLGDQPFWGERVNALGVGPTPIPRSKLTTQRLAAALHEVLQDQGMKHRAQGLGQAIQSERGIEAARRWIEKSWKLGEK